MTTYPSIHLGPCLHNCRTLALLSETPWGLLGALSVLRNSVREHPLAESPVNAGAGVPWRTCLPAAGQLHIPSPVRCHLCVQHKNTRSPTSHKILHQWSFFNLGRTHSRAQSMVPMGREEPRLNPCPLPVSRFSPICLSSDSFLTNTKRPMHINSFRSSCDWRTDVP